MSADTVKSHRRFKKMNQLPFPLLADPETAVLRQYGVWGEKTSYGRTYEGIHRTTCVIGPDGIIVKVFEKVQPEGHSAEVLEFLRGSGMIGYENG
jgi:peroxiredoxin Q/BCP